MTSSGIVMEAPPSPQSVAEDFVRQYYTVLNEAPTHLHRFYNHQSSFVHGGVDNSEPSPVIGQKQIHQRIEQLNFRHCHAKITRVDSQATLDNGVVVQVTGELSNAGQPMRRFTQTFVLGAQSPKKYCVHNDIFRYQDEIISEERCEPVAPIVNEAIHPDGISVVQGPFAAIQPQALAAPMSPLQPSMIQAPLIPPELDMSIIDLASTEPMTYVSLLKSGGTVHFIRPPPHVSSALVAVVQPAAAKEGCEPVIPTVNKTIHPDGISVIQGPVAAIQPQALAAPMSPLQPSMIQAPLIPPELDMSIIDSNEPKTYVSLLKSGGTVHFTRSPPHVSSAPVAVVQPAAAKKGFEPVVPIVNEAIHPDGISVIQGPVAAIPPQSLAAPMSPLQPSIIQAPLIPPELDMSIIDSPSNEPKTYANLLKSGGTVHFTRSPPHVSSAPVAVVQPAAARSATPPTSGGYQNVGGRGNNGNVNNRGRSKQEQPRVQNRQDSGREGGRNSVNDDTPYRERRRPQTQNFNDINQLFLGNLPHTATEDELRDIFGEFGVIVDLRVHSKPPNKVGGAPGGRAPPNYGFVKYENQQGVQNCLQANSIFYPKDDKNGTPLNVEEIKKRGERPPYGGGRPMDNRGRGGGNGGPRRGLGVRGLDGL